MERYKFKLYYDVKNNKIIEGLHVDDLFSIRKEDMTLDKVDESFFKSLVLIGDIYKSKSLSKYSGVLVKVFSDGTMLKVQRGAAKAIVEGLRFRIDNMSSYFSTSPVLGFSFKEKEIDIYTMNSHYKFFIED